MSPTKLLDSIVQQYADRGQFSGVALIIRNGRPILKKAYGLADRAWNVPNKFKARFPICSITKQFTAALVLQLVDQGKLKLSQTIGDVMPEYKDLPVGTVTIREMSDMVGITERTIQTILNDLEDKGIIMRRKNGRKNAYAIREAAPLRHPMISNKSVGDLLKLVKLNSNEPVG